MKKLKPQIKIFKTTNEETETTNEEIENTEKHK
jgi:hypothetical protein